MNKILKKTIGIIMIIVPAMYFLLAGINRIINYGTPTVNYSSATSVIYGIITIILTIIWLVGDYLAGAF